MTEPYLTTPPTMLDTSDGKNTLFDPNNTYHYDKISCMKGMYFAHVFFAYIVALSGLGCFITRAFPQTKWMHKWLGKIYIIGMLWCTATSLVIHNTGLPAATLISFIWVGMGLSLGWIVISIHSDLLQKDAMKAVQADMANGARLQKDLDRTVVEKMGEIVNNRTWMQRFFSLKTLHACLMFTSWINIVGRIFASNQSGDFTCHTYPVYKPINTKHFKGSENPITFVPIHDSNYARLPWAKSLTGWGVALSLGPFLGTAALALIYSLALAHFRKPQQHTPYQKDDFNVYNSQAVEGAETSGNNYPVPAPPSAVTAVHNQSKDIIYPAVP